MATGSSTPSQPSARSARDTVVVAAITAAATMSASPVLRVMTWNVWWRFGPWQQRQQALGAVLAEQRPDVVGLQEVWIEEGGRNQAAELAEVLGYRWVTTTPRFREGFAFVNAVLSRWPIVEATTAPLPRADGEPSHRQALLANIAAPFGRLLFVTTHLDFAFDGSATRVAQTCELARLIADRRGDPAAAFPPVLAGDFNALDHADELRLLTGATASPVPGLVFTDAWTVGGDGSPGFTWDPANPHLAEATWPNRRLDYVLVGWPRRKPLGTVDRCWLAGRDPVGGVVASDHYAVVADLRTG